MLFSFLLASFIPSFLSDREKTALSEADVPVPWFSGRVYKGPSGAERLGTVSVGEKRFSSTTKKKYIAYTIMIERNVRIEIFFHFQMFKDVFIKKSDSVLNTAMARK